MRLKLMLTMKDFGQNILKSTNMIYGGIYDGKFTYFLQTITNNVGYLIW